MVEQLTQVRPGFFLLTSITVLQRTRDVVNTEVTCNARIQTISKGSRNRGKSGMYVLKNAFCLRMNVLGQFSQGLLNTLSLTVAKSRELEKAKSRNITHPPDAVKTFSSPSFSGTGASVKLVVDFLRWAELCITYQHFDLCKAILTEDTYGIHLDVVIPLVLPCMTITKEKSHLSL